MDKIDSEGQRTGKANEGRQFGKLKMGEEIQKGDAGQNLKPSPPAMTRAYMGRCSLFIDVSAGKSLNDRNRVFRVSRIFQEGFQTFA